MARTIKITERQLKEQESNIIGLYDTGELEYKGNAEVSADGKTDKKNYSKAHTGDDFASANCPQAYNRYGCYGYWHGRISRLKEEATNDTDNDGIDDFYNDKEIDILGNGDETDNLAKIPKGIDDKLNILLNDCASLTAKQKAIVLNKILETFDISTLGYKTKKLLLKKLMVKKS